MMSSGTRARNQGQAAEPDITARIRAAATAREPPHCASEAAPHLEEVVNKAGVDILPSEACVAVGGPHLRHTRAYEGCCTASG